MWPLVEVSGFGRFGVAHLGDDHDNMLGYDLAGISKQNSKCFKIEWIDEKYDVCPPSRVNENKNKLRAPGSQRTENQSFIEKSLALIENKS